MSIDSDIPHSPISAASGQQASPAKDANQLKQKYLNDLVEIESEYPHSKRS